MQVGEDLIGYLDRTPQPVAQALGRVVRASGQAERLEAVLKAAEVVTRYLAVTGLGSAAATRAAASPPLQVEAFSGNLSFGHFEAGARAAYSAVWDHPLRTLLREHLRPSKKNKGRASSAIEALVELRNQLGHALTPADEHRARAIFADIDPIGRLRDLLDGVTPVLELPIVAALAQDYRRGQYQARLSFYLGEGEPIPRQLSLSVGLFEWESPYLCTEQGLVPLSAGLLLHPQRDGRLGLHIIDGIRAEGVRYKSTYDNAVVETDRTLSDLSRWVQLPFDVSAAVPPCPFLEKIQVEDGRSLVGYVRGDPLPKDEAPAKIAVDGGKPGSTITSVQDFEEHANHAGLGLSYRDILYFLLQLGHRVELGEGGIRVVSGIENRVLLVAKLRPGPELALSIWPGAFPGREESEPVLYTLRPDQSADPVLDALRQLMEPSPAPVSTEHSGAEKARRS
jgi:hypothetical protein